MSIIQEALRRKAENPNAPPPSFPATPPPLPSPGRKKARRKKHAFFFVTLLLLLAIAAGVFLYIHVFPDLRFGSNPAAPSPLESDEEIPGGFSTTRHAIVESPAPEPPSSEPVLSLENKPLRTPSPDPEPDHAEPPADPVPASSSSKPPSDSWPSLTLTGVLSAKNEGEREGLALFQGKGARSENETIQGIRIVRIEANAVTLEFNGEQRVLRPGQSTDAEQ